jgi:PAS domain S-box-containing protein
MGPMLIEVAALGQRVRQQDILAELGACALRGGDSAPLLQEASRLVAAGLQAEICAILQCRADDGPLDLAASVGLPDPTAEALGPDLVGTAWHAIRVGEAVVSSGAGPDSEVPLLLRRHGSRRAIDVVIWSGGEKFGVIEAGCATPGGFGPGDVAFAQAAANLLGVALARKQSEVALAAAETRTSDILESISDSFYALDRHWRFTYLNRRCEEWCGKRRDELIGRVIWDVFPEAVNTPVQACHMRAAREKKVVVVETLSSVRPRWIEFSIYPAANGMAVYFRDVDKRRRADNALRESEERLRIATESAGIGTWELNMADRLSVRSAGHAAIFGNDPSKDWSDAIFLRHVVPEHRRRVEQARQQAFAIGAELRFTCRIRRANDGALRWIEVRGSPVRETSGIVSRYLGVVLDVTERKEAEATRERLADVLEQRVAERTRALAEANTRLTEEIAERKRAESALMRAQRHEAIGQLVAGVAHAFNNLLTTTIGSLELLNIDALEGRPRRHIERAMQAAVQAGTLTNKLLAFAGQQQLAPRPVDANKVLIGMQELLLQTLGRHIRMQTDCAPHLWTAAGDPEQLQMLVLNLALNARDAMPKGGHLNVGTRNLAEGDPALPDELPAGDYVVLSVADDGRGMDSDVLARACEPFFTTKPQGRGSGLGLAQVDGVMRELGGTLRLRSAVGAGTTVELFLPRSKEVAADEVPGQSGAAPVRRVDH